MVVCKDIRTWGKKQDAQTFKNDTIFQAPKIVNRVQAVQITYRSRSVSENVELVGTSKILGRVESETMPICTGQCRELCIKIRDLDESQAFLLVLKTAEVPQNLLKAWIVTKNL
jgi:hypothetical protein